MILNNFVKGYMVCTNWSFCAVGVNWKEMATPSPNKKVKRGPPARELGVANSTRGVWLVKVPNYLADAWKDAEPDSELGRMHLLS